MDGGAADRVGAYLQLKKTQDTDNVDTISRLNIFQEFSVKQQNKLEFFTVSLSKVSKKVQDRFVASDLLEEYRHYLEKLFRRADHVLSEPEEQVVSLFEKPAYENWWSMTSRFLNKEEATVLTESGKKEVKNFNELSSLTTSKDREVRDSAGEAMDRILEEHVEVGENEFNSVLEYRRNIDHLRGYDRPDGTRIIESDVTPEFIDTLREVVKENHDLSHRYYSLVSRVLDRESIGYHERGVELGELELEIPFDKATEIAMDAFNSLDSSFADIFKSMLEDNRLDVFPKKGKTGGAFCANLEITLPTYVLLNYTGKLKDVKTLAHEMGHAFHGELAKENCNAFTWEYSLAIAEVASTFMEDFVVDQLMDEADTEQQFAILARRLLADTTSIFRQMAFYEFEWEAHHLFRDEGYLDKEMLGKLFKKSMSSYLGDSVEMYKGSENWWLYIPHFRMVFYVFSYASGQLISKALQNRVLNDPDAISDYIHILSAGSSKSPVEIFADISIDIHDKGFWQQGLDQMRGDLDRLEELAVEMGMLPQG
jgi:oligoendopeptidase F